MTKRIVLADDQPLVRAGLRMVIADAPDLEIVGEAGTGTEAVRLVRELRPDVVVMDIQMPGMDGIEATRMITADTSAPRVLMLTTFASTTTTSTPRSGRGPADSWSRTWRWTTSSPPPASWPPVTPSSRRASPDA